MRITFSAFASAVPAGGALVPYETANAMRRRGHDVHILHLHRSFLFRPELTEVEKAQREHGIESVEELDWVTFEPGIEHHFPDRLHETLVPDGDFVVSYPTELPDRCGLPLTHIQGHYVAPPAAEARALGVPYPKACVARWLVELALARGVDPDQVWHVPNGLDHRKYALSRPIATREPIVVFRHRLLPLGVAEATLQLLELVKHAVPDLRVLAFGSDLPAVSLPDWVDYQRMPQQRVLVDDIYNRGAVFVNTTPHEGFGLPSIEAMACGNALVTYDNGGSREFADHDRTALVVAAGELEKMAVHVASLLLDEELRVRIATAGLAETVRFSWDRTAELLESHLLAYALDPSRYRREVHLT